MKAYDAQLLDMKDSARHEREINRKKREKEVKERDRDVALALLQIEEQVFFCLVFILLSLLLFFKVLAFVFIYLSSYLAFSLL